MWKDIYAGEYKCANGDVSITVEGNWTEESVQKNPTVAKYSLGKIVESASRTQEVCQRRQPGMSRTLPYIATPNSR